jgi:hypothetical protein
VIATAYDTSEVCFGKYPDAPDIVAKLRELGVLVLFGVDARSLEKCSELRKWSADRGGFDKIVFNFPHAGTVVSTLRAPHSLIRDFDRRWYNLTRPEYPYESASNSRILELSVIIFG